MFQKGFQIQLKRSYRRFELMREAVDEVILKTIHLICFLMIYKNEHNPHQNNSDQNGKDNNDNPGLGCENLVWIEIEFMHQRIQALTCFNIPVNIQEKGQYQGDNRQNKDKYRMENPFGMVHVRKNSISPY